MLNEKIIKGLQTIVFIFYCRSMRGRIRGNGVSPQRSYKGFNGRRRVSESAEEMPCFQTGR